MMHSIRPFPKVIGLLAVLTLVSCSDTKRLGIELKDLQESKGELTAEYDTLSKEVTESQKAIQENEKGSQVNAKAQATALLKTESLQTRLTYLQEATKKAEEQSTKLAADVAKYRATYLTK
jgi:predicted nuclease with TOPRIM domain